MSLFPDAPGIAAKASSITSELVERWKSLYHSPTHGDLARCSGPDPMRDIFYA